MDDFAKLCIPGQINVCSCHQALCAICIYRGYQGTAPHRRPGGCSAPRAVEAGTLEAMAKAPGLHENEAINAPIDAPLACPLAPTSCVSKNYASSGKSMSVPVTKLFVQYVYIGGTMGSHSHGCPTWAMGSSES